VSGTGWFHLLGLTWRSLVSGLGRDSIRRKDPGRDFQRWHGFVDLLVGYQIERAPDAKAGVFLDMSIDHGGTDVFMAEEILYAADVAAFFEQVCGK